MSGCNTLVVFVCLFIICCQSFNVDVSSPLDFTSGSIGDQFGYAVALHRSDSDYWALVGAPMSNVTGDLQQPFNGAVFRCKLNGAKSPCINMKVDDTVPGSQEIKKKQMMGATLLSTGENQTIVACAPRFKDTPREATKNFVWLHGRCFVIDGKTFAIGQPVWNPCKNKKQGNLHYGYCQTGFSATVSESSPKFIISGMPGVLLGLGRVAVQRLNKVLAGTAGSSVAVTASDRLKNNDINGYAVAWGRFSNALYGDMVGGAPQGNDGKGKVIIYRVSGDIPVQAVIENTDATMATGSYFGSVLCVVDLNNDKKSDLLVGAPLYSVNEDEGKVYVYTTDAKGAVSLKGTITGEGTIRGKFGSSIAAVGDLNGDGFPDVAVGAPYGGPDGNGAVYIYHGSSAGLGNNFQPVQKIYSANIPGKPITFGHSISGNLDVDSNSYPDIVVGSYQASKVHFFKSRAVFSVAATIDIDKTSIALSNKTSSTCKADHQCINATFCLTYSGKGAPAQIDLTIIMNLDKDQVGGKRALVFSGSQKISTINSTRQYKKGQKQCFVQRIYIMEKVNDLLSPIVIGVSYQYKEPTGGCSPGPCPIADLYAKKSVQKLVTYLKDCGTDDVCQSDLDLNATSVFPKGYTELVFGLVDTYTVKVIVMNKGENAYLAKLAVDFPDDLSAIGVEFINEPNPLWEIQKFKNGTSRVEFSMDNPFPSNHKLEIYVKFTPAKPRPRAKKLSFTVTTSTVSQETNTKNNRQVLTVDAALLADLTVSGSANPPNVFYGKEKQVEVGKMSNASQVGPLVTYNFLVQNHGPSPVQEVYTQISLLTHHKKKWIAMLFDAKVDGSLGCELGAKKNPFNLTVNEEAKSRRRRDTSGSSVVDLNCRTGTCITFNCYIGSLTKGQSKKVILRTRIFQNTFIEEERPLTKLSSVISILILGEEKEFLRQPQGHKPDKAEVSVQVRPLVITQKKKEPIAWWIILLAVMGAILQIIALVLIFWKVGFFERKLKGKNITGPTDEYDNSM